ncbi:MAG: glutamine--fructose-6-phosphate transaminase (isomerizing) [Parachlamydiales bacterium]|nr:glutamine--fructose-6-phosphate transaminase (isomerizing) [Parachlamydiales bacterium]
MCGIFGYIGNKNSIKECLQGLKLLEYRGYDSAGIATIQDAKILSFKSPGKLIELEKKINIFKDLKFDLAIGHTRWATHGSPTLANAHPHFDEKLKLAIVHNGIIENYASIRKKLLSKNILFRSETDTEVMAQLISYYYANDLLKAFDKAIKELTGSYAIALIHANHPDEIVASSKESPIVIGFDDNKDEIIISSDPNAFLGRNLNILFLKNNEIAHIKNKKINIYDKNLKIIHKKTERLNSKNISFSKNGFEHYLLKEIYEQPLTIQKAFLGRIQLKSGEVEFEDFNLPKSFLKKFKHIIITACGTSYHAGLCASNFFQKYLKINCSVEIASEMRFKDLNLTKDTLIIAISQSGETADTLSAIRKAKENNCHILSIVNVKNSTIARESDSSIFLKAGPEISVCSTKAFTSQITVLYLLAIYFARSRNLLEKKDAQIFLKELKKIPNIIKKILKKRKEIEKIAQKYAIYNSFFFLGRNLMYPTAMEAALKLKEISYIDANAYPAGEMKHGPLALISEKLPIVGFCLNEKTYDKMLSNLMEAKARSAPILAIASKKSYGIEDIADDIIWVDKVIDDLAIFPATIVGQLLAYFIAIIKKTDIDQPRNLAKSVTVE